MIRRIQRFLSESNKAAKINSRVNAYEWWRQSYRLHSYPSTLRLDPANICNLKCPFCPTGNATSKLRFRGIMQPEVFYKIVSHIPVKYLVDVHLYIWGEPLLNPHIVDYIDYFAEQGKRVFVSTNFSTKEYDNDFLEQLVKSGLFQLILSIDGASQRTYERYRRNGDFERVIKNAQRLSEIVKGSGSNTPRIVYRMLLNRFNEMEVDKAAHIANEIGAYFLADSSFGIPSEHVDEWAPQFGNRAHSEEFLNTGPGICRQLWDTLTVDANGDVFPCCIVCDSSSALGNLTEQHLDEIRNGQKMTTLRRFIAHSGNAQEPDFYNSCTKCMLRHKYRIYFSLKKSKKAIKDVFVEFNVQDKETEQPISESLIIHPQTGFQFKTDSRGKMSFKIFAGQYSMNVYAEGYLPGENKIANITGIEPTQKIFFTLMKSVP